MTSNFIKSWEAENNGVDRLLTDPEEQEKFLVAATELLRYLAHTGRSASIFTVKQGGGDAISSVFIRIT